MIRIGYVIYLTCLNTGYAKPKIQVNHEPEKTTGIRDGEKGRNQMDRIDHEII